MNTMKMSSVVMSLLIFSNTSMADNQNYIAFDMGSSTMTNTTSAYLNSANVRPAFPNPGNFRFALGHQYNSQFAFEVGYTKFGEAKIDWGGTNGYETVTGSSLQLAGIGSFPVTESINLLGKLGVASNNAEYKDVYPAANSTTTATYSNTAIMYGFGAQIKLSENFSMRGMYENLGNFRESTNSGVTTFTIGAVLGF